MWRSAVAIRNATTASGCANASPYAERMGQTVSREQGTFSSRADSSIVEYSSATSEVPDIDPPKCELCALPRHVDALVAGQPGQPVRPRGLRRHGIVAPVDREGVRVDFPVPGVVDVLSPADRLAVHLGAQVRAVSRYDRAAEELGDAAGAVAEGADGLVGQVVGVVEQCGQPDVHRCGVTVPDHRGGWRRVP